MEKENILSGIKSEYIDHFFKISKTSYRLYYLLIALFSIIVISLPILHFDITISATGSFKPNLNRTEVSSTATGIVDSIYVYDGEAVIKGDTILKLHSEVDNIKQSVDDLEKYQNFITDITALIKKMNSDIEVPLYFKTQQMKEFYHIFIYKKKLLDLEIQQLINKMDNVHSLVNDDLMMQADFNKLDVRLRNLQTNLSILESTQKNELYNKLLFYESKIEDTKSVIVNSERLIKNNVIKATTSGTIQNLTHKYSGSMLIQNEFVAIISPEAKIIAECYISPRDIGGVKLNQPVKINIDGIFYKDINPINGHVSSIDNDITRTNTQSFYRITCNIDSSTIDKKLRLRKGQTCRVNIVTANKSLWQILSGEMHGLFQSNNL